MFFMTTLGLQSYYFDIMTIVKSHDLIIIKILKRGNTIRPITGMGKNLIILLQRESQLQIR
jgi:hypothetical protein